MSAGTSRLCGCILAGAVVSALGALGCASGEDDGIAQAAGGRPGVGGVGGGLGGAPGLDAGKDGGFTSGGSGALGGSDAGKGGGGGECSGSAEQACYTGSPGTKGVGECKDGKQVCQGGTFGPCEGEITPTTEVCDNRDNDCDGLADEELGQTTCGQGICLVTVDNCLNGTSQTCVPKTPSTAEKCDGADDDCDGQVDEGCSCQDGQTQACYSGDPLTKGVGECVAGKQTCSAGKWGTCQGQVLPAAEACNGQDDDCDGKIDDGSPGGGVSCSTGKLGECAKGVSSCVNGTTLCNQTVTPVNEVCDGKDNNCDGKSDEGNPGSGTTCSTGKPGECSGGTTQCLNGSVTCVQNLQPTTEKCDGKDNNCDGKVDEGCNCTDGTSQGCYTGPPGTQGIGICKGGTQTCANGQWGTCTGQVVPKTEACNNLDDNCNGTKDENNPGGGAACSTGKPGICAAGTLTCQTGVLTCVQNQQPAPSDICGNSLDDNCNGASDENCGCVHDKCTIGVKLTAGCDSAQGNCVSQVCNADSWCCTQDWDSLCVSEVRTVCKSLKCAEAQGACSHLLCTPYLGPLVNNCDSAKANCVSKICAQDSYCCSTDWDSICVNEISSICAQNCN